MDVAIFQTKPFVSTMINAVLVLYGVIDLTVGHGRLWEPPSRSSMWRRGYNTTININDNELSCGGFTNQWITYGGLCGVCGDPYQQKPRDNEIGGKYASGIITRTYPIGGKIDVIIGLTANHMGYFEFKLCPIADPAIGETQDCMDSHRLKLLNGEDNGYRFYIRDPNLEGNVRLTLILPRHFFCEHCVLQWKYRTGTRWGCEHDLSCGKGKGPQEEFYGCSDISIADVATTLYNDPVIKLDPGKGVEGLNDLGAHRAHRAHTVIWSIKPTQPHKYFTHKPQLYTKPEPEIVKDIKGPHPLASVHNKHMASLRFFLEELTLRALMRYYGTKRNHEHADCSPTKKYRKNPIVHEFCERICSYDPNVCPDLLCFCTRNSDTLKQRTFTKAPEYFLAKKNKHGLNRGHLKKFARKLIAENKLVENIPVAKLKLNSHTRDIRIPRFGKMEVIKPEPKRFAVRSRFRATKRALQEDNFIPSKYISRKTMADVDPSMNKLVTKSSFHFGPVDRLVPVGVGAHPPTPVVKPKAIICTASVSYSHNPFMAKWCNTNCPFGFCPPRVCSCD